MPVVEEEANLELVLLATFTTTTTLTANSRLCFPASASGEVEFKREFGRNTELCSIMFLLFAILVYRLLALLLLNARIVFFECFQRRRYTLSLLNLDSVV